MKKSLLFFVLSISPYIFFSQEFLANNWTSLIQDDFSIDYPKIWKLDTSEQMNTKFLLLSKLKENDTFSENINLIIQDLTNQNISMSKFVEISENQIKTMVPGYKIITSKDNIGFYELIWKGNVSGRNLHFKQYFFLKDKKAYILTFTALQTTFEGYINDANKILNSFKLKK